MEAGKKLVYVCEGGDCSERGSIDLYGDLREMLKEQGKDKEIRLLKYPCFGGCEHGINVALYPDKVFYSKVQTKDLPEIVEHLTGDGKPVERLTGAVAKDVEEIVWTLLDTGF